MAIRTRKRLLFVLSAVSLALVALFITGVWYLTRGDANLGLEIVFYILITLGIMFLVVVAFGLFSVGLAILTKGDYLLFERLMRFSVNTLFPIALRLARLLTIPKEKLAESYVAINNYLVERHGTHTSPDRVLVLIPHCAQWTGCPHKITVNPENCQRCGRCRIAEALDLADRYGFHIRIASGGTQARKAVLELKPKAIVAVACQRELLEGIQDVVGVEVIGVPNLRPHGPCTNTSFNVDVLEKAVLKFVNGGEAACYLSGF